MAILASDLKAAMAAVLGVAGTQRYLVQQHYIPAMQAAQRRLNGMVGAIFAENKGGEELFSEITETRIFQTNAFGGISLLASELGHPVWSIVAIYPEAVPSPTDNILALPDAVSQWRSDLTLKRVGKFPCERMTLEQAAIAADNRFMSGNEILASGPRRSYGYYVIGNRAAAGWAPGDIEFIVTPESISGKKLMGVSYLRGIEVIQSLDDTMPYPASAFQLLRGLALNDISIRQGSTPLFNVTMDDVRTMLALQA